MQEQLNNLLRRGGPILQQIPQEQLQSIQIRLAEIGPIADRNNRIRILIDFTQIKKYVELLIFTKREHLVFQ